MRRGGTMMHANDCEGLGTGSPLRRVCEDARMMRGAGRVAWRVAVVAGSLSLSMLPHYALADHLPNGGPLSHTLIGAFVRVMDWVTDATATRADAAVAFVKDHGGGT